MKSNQSKPKKQSGQAYEKLKEDLRAGTVSTGYLFFGAESYLREHYLGELRRVLVPEAFAEFNYHRMEGKDLTVQDIADAVEAMPMLAERTLVEVTDYDIFKQGEDQRGKLIALLEDLPPYCCLVFVYDTL